MSSNTWHDIRRIASHLGDAILQHEKRDSDGNVILTEIVMFVPKIVMKEKGN